MKSIEERIQEAEQQIENFIREFKSRISDLENCATELRRLEEINGRLSALEAMEEARRNIRLAQELAEEVNQRADEQARVNGEK